jgi:hypothetical protein
LNLAAKLSIDRCSFFSFLPLFRYKHLPPGGLKSKRLNAAAADREIQRMASHRHVCAAPAADDVSKKISGKRLFTVNSKHYIAETGNRRQLPSASDK